MNDGSQPSLVSRHSVRRFLCVDCGVNTSCRHKGIGEFYVVWEWIWEKAGMHSSGGMLCIGCLEKRFGRELTRADFKMHAPIMQPEWGFQSERLRDRISRW